MNIFKEIKRMMHIRAHGVFTALSVVASPSSSGDAVNKSSEYYFGVNK